MSNELEESVFGSSSVFMLNIDLNELNEPHKLAKWFKILGKYRKCYLNTHIKYSNIDNNNNGDKNCELISKFMYQTQICGKHIKSNFNETDFKRILNIIHDDNTYNYDHFKWIWEIIQYAQSINTTIDIKQESERSNMATKLKWIPSSWNKFEIIEQDELIHNELNNIDFVPKTTEKKSIITSTKKKNAVDNMSPTNTEKLKSNTANTKNIRDTKKITISKEEDDHKIYRKQPSKSPPTKVKKNENIRKRDLDHDPDNIIVVDHDTNREDVDKQYDEDKETEKLLDKEIAGNLSNQSIRRERVDSLSGNEDAMDEPDFASQQRSDGSKGDYQPIPGNEGIGNTVNGNNNISDSLSVANSINDEQVPSQGVQRQITGSKGPCCGGCCCCIIM